jgi:putative flippase GtrA
VTERAPRRFPARLRLLFRHQIGATAATLVDFSTMIALVRVGLTPVQATACGAACGAVTNFTLSRRWIFDAAHAHAGAQALRYAAVSLASLLLNAAGEHVFHDLLHVQYVLARVIVSVAVSVLWNFTMHRLFVFRAPPSPKPAAHRESSS